MRPWLIIVLLTGLLYQIVALPLYRVGPLPQLGMLAPDFLLIAAAYVALYETRRRALLLAASLGLLVDALSLDPWGVHALGYAGAAGILALAQGAGWGSDPLLRSLGASIAAAAAAAARAAIVWDGDDAGRFHDLLSTSLSAAYTAALAPVVFALLDPLRGWLVTPRYRRLQ